MSTNVVHSSELKHIASNLSVTTSHFCSAAVSESQLSVDQLTAVGDEPTTGGRQLFVASEKYSFFLSVKAPGS